MSLALSVIIFQPTSGRALRGERAATCWGRTIRERPTRPATIIGVTMPDGSASSTSPMLDALAQMPGLAGSVATHRPLMMIVRLPDSADLDRVRAELAPIARTSRSAYPDTNKAGPASRETR